MEKMLGRLGLANSEIKVYLSLLEMESSTVGPIIERSKVAPSKIYVILSKLKQRGLVSSVIKNNVQHFKASDPEHIIHLLNEREQEIKEQKRILQEELLPKWRNKNNQVQQSVTMYESVEGFRAALNFMLSVLKKGEEYCVFLLNDVLNDETLQPVFQQFHRRRVEQGVHVRILTTPGLKEQYENISKKYVQVRTTNKKLPVGVVLFNDHVLSFVPGNLMTVIVVHSKQQYNIYTEFFEDVWKTAK